LNINSFIKHSSIVVGTIGLIFTVYRILDEKRNKKPTPLPPTVLDIEALPPVEATQNNNLRDQAVPELEAKKY
jgi:hypothetical protein